jgi:hypothetical protein
MATTTDTYRVLVLHNSFRPLKRPPRPTPDGRTSPFVASSTPGESMHEFWPLYEAKDYEGALAVERQALEDYPGNALAHFNIACMSSLLGRPDDALEPGGSPGRVAGVGRERPEGRRLRAHSRRSPVPRSRRSDGELMKKGRAPTCARLPGRRSFNTW